MALRRTRLAYLILTLAWLLIAVWQLFEHCKVKDLARSTISTRAKDISKSLSVVIRSQSRFGAIRRSRLKAALEGLAKLSDLESVALQNPSGKIVASGGTPLSDDEKKLSLGSVVWAGSSLTVVELVELRDPDASDKDSSDGQVIVVDSPPGGSHHRRGFHGRPDDKHKPPPDDKKGKDEGPQGVAGKAKSEEKPKAVEKRPLTEEELKKAAEEAERKKKEMEAAREKAKQFRYLIARWVYSRYKSSGPWGGWRPRKPSDMTEEEFDKLFQQFVANRGVHRFVMKLNTSPIQGEIARDKWLRMGLLLIAMLGSIGVGMGWRSLHRSSDLQVRLVRAQEMNNHLREMNLAAAGLAHETRNPLNVVRGLAQMITQSPEDTSLVKRHAETAVGEVDRVTQVLNEFIEYSRPREPKPGPVEPAAVVDGIVRALESDLQDKGVELSKSGLDVTIDADEALLRQLLFNLLLNAIQAVPDGGRIDVKIQSSETGLHSLTVSDSGPGIPEEARSDIYRPYISLQETGTGLGLAVVRQIVLAHHWEIDYVESELGGAGFLISGITPTATDASAAG